MFADVCPISVPHHQDALVVTLVEGCLQRVEQSHLVVMIVCDCHAVDQQAIVGGIQVAIALHHPRAMLGKPLILGHQSGLYRP